MKQELSPMICRSVAIAGLCAVVLTGCSGSSDGGRPDVTVAGTATKSSAPVPRSTPSPSSRWDAEELTAIKGATARYVVARAAVERELRDPAKINRDALEKAGNGGEWLIAVVDDAETDRDDGWYWSGQLKISAPQVTSVRLGNEQPEVRLTSCVDASALIPRFTSNGKPVPLGPGNGYRHKFSSRLVYVTPKWGGPKMWFLVADKPVGAC